MMNPKRVLSVFLQQLYDSGHRRSSQLTVKCFSVSAYFDTMTVLAGGFSLLSPLSLPSAGKALMNCTQEMTVIYYIALNEFNGCKVKLVRDWGGC